jgi:hypothetical protein
MWKLGLLPRNFFCGNICFEFSVLVLCSDYYDIAWIGHNSLKVGFEFENPIANGNLGPAAKSLKLL